jgi:hypothetical protein
MTRPKNGVSVFVHHIIKMLLEKNNIKYLMNRDGFSFLVMGFTGQKANQWKWDYIKAFNTMEEVFMTRITTKEAAQRLNMTVLTVQVLLQQSKLPIGYAVMNPGSSKYHYIIYQELLEGYINRVEKGEL